MREIRSSDRSEVGSSFATGGGLIDSVISEDLDEILFVEGESKRRWI